PRPASAPRLNASETGRASRAREGQLAQADREREERFILPEERRRLQDRVQIADRVFLPPDGPLTVEVHDRRQDVVERDLRLQGVTHRLLGGRRLVSQARLERGEGGSTVVQLRPPEPQEIRIAEFRRQGAIHFPQEPRVLRWREVATREARSMELAQRGTG